ncbi:DUF4112 domain-containing protein [Azospirillum sp. B506]|uniref:DUF4112 domain-containing protein n=1 Tax=Azospirillum sp. B506 TaxID=137721 RepID=UPI0003478271|nr:DUF4112 domain-containing protein [Azospirillum sp. B506]
MIDAIRTRRRSVAEGPSPGGGGSTVPIDFQRLERLRRLARLMDTRWRIPFTRIPVGLDGIASLVPVAGDTATAIVSAYIIMEAARFDLPKVLVARMVFNVLLDWAGGSVPVLGTVFDIAFKANRMNLNLLHEHLEKRLAAAARR